MRVWGLLLEEQTAVLFLLSQQEAIVLSSPQKWSLAKPRSLLKTTTLIINQSQLEQPPTKVVFFVPHSWLADESKLQPRFKQILGKVCQATQWQPLGFVSEDELFLRWREEQDGSTPSFVLIFAGESGWRITLIHLGKIKDSLWLKSEKTSSSAEQIEEGMRRLQFEGVFPPQIVVWGPKCQQLATILSEHNWNQSGAPLFLHLPEIIQVEWQQLARIAQNIIFEQSNKEKTLPPTPFGKTDQPQQEKPQTKPKKTQKTKKEEAPLPPKPTPEFEFVQDADWQEPPVIRPTFKLPKITSPTSWLTAFWQKITKVPPLVKIKVWPLISFLLIAFCCFAWFWPQATISLHFSPKKLEKEIEAQNLPGDWQTFILTEEVSGPTTGSKLVGEKAKGEVVLYNRTSKAKTFPPGTVLVGPGGLEFVLTQEIKVASKTPDLASGVDRWGEAKVGVEARQIGAKYNIAAETTLRVKGISSEEVLVKAASDFEGGFAREIRVVSAEDKKRLRAEAEKKLKQKAIQQAQSYATPQKQVLLNTLQLNIQQEEWEYDQGEEAEQTTLQMKAEAKVLTVEKSALVYLAQNLFGNEQIGNDWEIKNIDFAPEGKLILDLIPKIKKKELAQKLAGRPLGFAEDVLRHLPRVYRYQIKLKHQVLPGKRLPWRWQNIQIEIY